MLCISKKTECNSRVKVVVDNWYFLLSINRLMLIYLDAFHTDKADFVLTDSRGAFSDYEFRKRCFNITNLRLEIPF